MDTHASVELFDAGEFCLILLVKPANKEKTYLFFIHKITGSVDFSGMENHGVFRNIGAAEGFIDIVYEAKLIAKGIGLTGLVRIGSRLYMNIITEAVPIAYFANKHTIFKVTKTQPLWFNLSYYPKCNDDDMRRSQRIEDFPITDFHIFCNTYDLSMTCGRSVSKPDFVWNNWMAKPFSDLGVRDACVYLYQGTATSSQLGIYGTVYRFSLITLRSAEHPGTRYTARGINRTGYAANEVQCELIIETTDGKIYSHVFRRGTVPVEWQTLVGQALPTASLKVEDNSDKYSHLYFKRIRKEFDAPNFFKGFVIVNLLHSDPKHSERALCDAYIQAIEGVKKYDGLQNIQYIEFDWHAKKKELDTPKTVEEFWEQLLKTMGEPTFTTMEPVTPVDKTTVCNSDSFEFSNDEILSKCEMKTTGFQNYIYRFNCMDSLDRTNVGCFYYTCLIIIYFLCQKIPTPLTYNNLFETDAQLRRFLANAFIDIGNVVSTMYTNTDACMTNIFRDVGGIEEKAQSDGAIAMSRRFQNFVKDKFRVKIIKLFVGFDYDRVLHGLDHGTSIVCASSYPGCFLIPYPGSLNTQKSLEFLIDYKPAELKCDNVGQMTQIRLLLSRPVYIDSIVMKSTAKSAPAFISFDGGLTQTSIVPLSTKFAVPQVANKSWFVYKITPEFMNGKQTLVRILLINIYTVNKKINLSNIFVFGYTKPHLCIASDFPQTYTDLSWVNLNPTQRWPRITDTSSLVDSILSYSQPTFENSIMLELSRLHHKHSRLALLAELLYFGHNPGDYIFSNFKPRPISDGRHVCNNPSSSTWKCGSCGNIFCENCSVGNHVDNIILFDGEIMVCDKCYSIYQKRIAMLANLSKFYNYYTRLHYPVQDDWEKWFKPRVDNKNFLEFPRASFIDAGNNMTGEHEKPECNLLFCKGETAAIKGDHNFQLTLGAIHVIDRIELECSDDTSMTIHAVGLDDDTSQSGLTFEVKFEPGVKSKDVTMLTNLLIIYMNSGTLNKITFHTQQYIRNFIKTPMDDEVYHRLPDPLTKRANISFTEPFVLVKFSKATNVTGILCEKFNAVGALIIYFITSDIESSGELEYFNLPLGATDFAINLWESRTESLRYERKEAEKKVIKGVIGARIYAVDAKPDFTNGKISFF